MNVDDEIGCISRVLALRADVLGDKLLAIRRR
jgi:hypothetical protein